MAARNVCSVKTIVPHYGRRTRSSNSHSISRPSDWWMRMHRSYVLSCCPRPLPLQAHMAGRDIMTRWTFCDLYTPGPCSYKQHNLVGREFKKWNWNPPPAHMHTCILSDANLHAPDVTCPALEDATELPLLCPLQGWLQLTSELPSLPCCVFTAGMWEFLHALGLWRATGLSAPFECLTVGDWMFGTSGERGACGARPGLDVLTWTCWLEFCLGGRSEECWEERPVGLLGGTDRSAAWWWSPGWNASPFENKNIMIVVLKRRALKFTT